MGDLGAHPSSAPGIRLSDALAAGQANRLGLVRLILAFTVVASHSYHLLVGNQSTEPLFRLTGVLSFGELAVMGFFLISGLLVTASRAATPGLAPFARKRVARIVPGFVAAFVLTLAIGTLTGGDAAMLAGPDGIKALARLLLLQQPILDGAFARAPDPQMNSPMWTIPYEAMCYAAAAALGAGRIARQPRVLLWLTCITVLSVLLEPWHVLSPGTPDEVGIPHQVVRLLAVFLIGACAFQFRSAIVLRGPLAALAAALALPMLLVPALLFTAAPVFGGYALLWATFKGHPGLVGGIGTRTDISYGLYLYAWPVQNTLVCLVPGLSPWLLTALATPLAATLAYASWRILERPAIRLAKRRPADAREPIPG